MKRFLIGLSILVVTGNALLFGAGRGDEVLVVYNSRMSESKGVAEHYAAMREVPSSQVLGLDLPEVEAMSRTDFRERLQKPLGKALESKGLVRYDVVVTPATNGEPRKAERKIVQSKIRYLALCYGVPLIISKDPNLHEPGVEKMPAELHRNEAAVDSELACLPFLDTMMLAGPRANPLYGCTNAQQLSLANGILLVARLDGPTADIARSLVDKAMQAETNGLWGRAYFDLRGVTNAPLKLGDDWIHGASEICRRTGFETIVDSNGATFPATFPLSQVAFYAGWYDENVSGPFARPTVEFMPGAFAYHLHSFSAATLRSTKRQWAGPFLDRGATATMGCVDEPYLAGTPNIAMFFARFILSGFSYGEAAYSAQNFLSWQTTVVGDPLYRPFEKSPAQLQTELELRHSKLMEWAFLRVVNFNLVQGVSLNRAMESLEGYSGTKDSAVLEEKLAQLYQDQGKPDSSVHALEQTLKLNPSPQQRVRVMLALGEQLEPLARYQDEFNLYQDFQKRFPDYPDQISIMRKLLWLAEKLDKKDEAAKYRREVDQLTAPHPPPKEGPPLRHGT